MSRPVVASVHLAHLRHNYRILKQLAASARLMAVIKADAYGHGLALVAPALFDAGCREFAVTDAEEGARLRRLLGKAADITVLSGVFDDEDARLCADHHLQPVISTGAQLERLRRQGFGQRAWIKADSGMHRLGADDVPQLADALLAGGMQLAGVMSHLACADEPQHPLNQAQIDRFSEILRSVPKGTAASLLNSAGLAAIPRHAFDVVRPGIALYGVEPLRHKTLGLKPVMRLTGRVMQLLDVPKGDGISYGATFVAPRDMRLAIVALGYGDGLPRALSNYGEAVWRNHRLAIVGRVCMDYCLLDAGHHAVAAGDEVEFWGGHLAATAVAERAGTIAYELFTRLPQRVPRRAMETA